jgi:4-diphosphocytidyl-2-C-methyl-D-erythritol kinase
MTLRAYAKINIGLHVVGKRPDGYHNIETVLYPIDLYDEVSIHEHEEEGIHFQSFGANLPHDQRNLCVRAAQLVMDVTGVRRGVEIVLLKSIPIGAGLGGGSSDAAAVLKGLVKLWSLDITVSELELLGSSLGSDVPYFIRGGTAFATGRGEILEPLTINLPYWIAVITPPIHISTAWAYQQLELRQQTRKTDWKNLLTNGSRDSAEMRSRLFNDFEKVVFRHHTEIKKIKDQLQKEGADVVLMSGTGSSVFGLFRDEPSLDSISSLFPSSYHLCITPPSFHPIAA